MLVPYPLCGGQDYPGAGLFGGPFRFTLRRRGEHPGGAGAFARVFPELPRICWRKPPLRSRRAPRRPQNPAVGRVAAGAAGRRWTVRAVRRRGWFGRRLSPGPLVAGGRRRGQGLPELPRICWRSCHGGAGGGATSDATTPPLAGSPQARRGRRREPWAVPAPAFTVWGATSTGAGGGRGPPPQPLPNPAAGVASRWPALQPPPGSILGRNNGRGRGQGCCRGRRLHGWGMPALPEIWLRAASGRPGPGSSRSA